MFADEVIDKVGNAVHRIRAHALDMLAATTRLLAALGMSPERIDAGEAYLRARMHKTLETHADDLRNHLTVLGAHATPQTAAHAGQPVSAASDLFSRIGLLHAAQLMLETDARALGFSSTAALAARHREELETLLAQLRELLPEAA